MTDGSTKPQTGAMLLNAGIANGEFNVPTVHFQFVNATNGIACQIGNNGKLPINWILLDNQSTVDVFVMVTSSPTSARIRNLWIFTAMPES